MKRPLGSKDSNGYIKTQVMGVKCYAHQLMYFLYNGHWANLIDHKDQNRSNNKPDNLVKSNYSANALNSKLWSTNVTGVKGVSFTKGRFKVTACGKFYGYFDTLKEAREVAHGAYQHS